MRCLPNNRHSRRAQYNERISMDISKIIGREWVLNKAERALAAKNQFITDDIAPLSEGGFHDFYSNADYWRAR